MAEEESEEKKSSGGLIKIILFAVGGIMLVVIGLGVRSEERRVGKECRSRWSPYH